MKRSAISVATAAALSVAIVGGPAQAQTQEGNVGCAQTQRCEVTTYTYPGGSYTDHDWYHPYNVRVGGDFWASDGKHTSASGMASVAHYDVTSDYLISVRGTDCIPKPVL